MKKINVFLIIIVLFNGCVPIHGMWTRLGGKAAEEAAKKNALSVVRRYFNRFAPNKTPTTQSLLKEYILPQQSVSPWTQWWKNKKEAVVESARKRWSSLTSSQQSNLPSQPSWATRKLNGLQSWWTAKPREKIDWARLEGDLNLKIEKDNLDLDLKMQKAKLRHAADRMKEAQDKKAKELAEKAIKEKRERDYQESVEKWQRRNTQEVKK